MGRFINADVLVNTSRGLLSHNMFAYCENNPITREDESGYFWKEIGNFFVGIGKSIANFCSSTFGAEFSVVEASNKTSFSLDPLPITAENGKKTADSISSSGNTSKPITAYSTLVQNSPLTSSAGININMGKVDLKLNASLNNTGVNWSYTDGSTTKSIGSSINISELKVGFEGAQTVQDGSVSYTDYTSVGINGGSAAMAWLLLKNGQYVPTPSLIPAY